MMMKLGVVALPLAEMFPLLKDFCNAYIQNKKKLAGFLITPMSRYCMLVVAPSGEANVCTLSDYQQVRFILSKTYSLCGSVGLVYLVQRLMFSKRALSNLRIWQVTAIKFLWKIAKIKDRRSLKSICGILWHKTLFDSKRSSIFRILCAKKSHEYITDFKFFDFIIDIFWGRIWWIFCSDKIYSFNFLSYHRHGGIITRDMWSWTFQNAVLFPSKKVFFSASHTSSVQMRYKLYRDGSCVWSCSLPLAVLPLHKTSNSVWTIWKVML